MILNGCRPGFWLARSQKFEEPHFEMSDERKKKVKRL
jgi:hypothetical protein